MIANGTSLVMDVASVDSGPAFKSTEFGEAGDGTPLLRGENIEPGALRWTKTKTWPDRLMNGYEHLLVEAGDLILGMDRPVVAAGLKLANVRSTDLPALLVQRVARIRPKTIDGRYLYHWLSSPQSVQHVKGSSTGTQLPHITLADIRNFEVPRFGDDAERRIVDLLEDQLSRLDAGDKYLAAVENRAVGLHGQLLSAALSEIQSEKFALSSLLTVGLANGKSVPTQEGGFPVLRLTALRNGRIDLAERKSGAWSAADAARFLVQRGDFLISRGNGSLRLVGRGGLLDQEPDPVAFPDTLIRARPDVSRLLPEFMTLVWNSPFVRRQIEASAKTTAGIYKVNQKDLGAVGFPLPSLPDQAVVVERVREGRDAIGLLSVERDLAVRRSGGLRRSLLAAAFSGRLTGASSDLSVAEEMIGA